MRRITTGITGRNLLGDLFTQNNVLQPVGLNRSLQLSGNGTAGVEVNNNTLLINNGFLSIKTSTVGGSINLKFAGATGYDVTFPDIGGDVNQILSVFGKDADGNVQLEYKDVKLVQQTDATTNQIFGIPFIASGNEISTLKTNATALNFNPSTSTLTAPFFSGDGADITNLKPDRIAVYNLPATTTTPYQIFFGEFATSGGPEDMLGYPRTTNFGNITNNPTFTINTGELKATLLTATSDVAHKSDISNIEDALDKVKKLRGVQYKRKFNNREEIGLIAQECESIIPSLVTGEDGNKGVAYGNITALLIEAIKEQQAEIENLKRKLSV